MRLPLVSLGGVQFLSDDPSEDLFELYTPCPWTVKVSLLSLLSPSASPQRIPDNFPPVWRERD